MTRLANTVRAFLLDEDGPTAVEYAVMIALIILVVIGQVEHLGRHTSEVFRDMANNMSGS